jgi:hypothetical protein
VAFKVRLSAPTEQTVTLQATTTNGTAIAGEDFTPLSSQNLTFAPGETEKTIEVSTIGDDTDETDENFTLQLSTAQFVFNGQPTGTVQFEGDDDTANGTILNDERTVSIGDASVQEGDSGTAELKFTMTLSAASAHPVTVQFATSDGSAISSGNLADYVASTGSVTFNPNETSKEVVILVKGDQRNESNETFNLTLSSSQNAIVSDGTVSDHRQR